MATGQRYIEPNVFEVDQNGVPMAGAQLFFYATGTSTPQNTFADVSLSTPNPNPVIADANGRFGNIWLITSNAYAVALYTAPTVANPSGTLVWTLDPVGPAAGGTPSNNAGIIGEVRQFAGLAASVPAGWYLCYGQAVSRTTYSALFAVIGTIWGAGDGTTTFNLPDMRGRVPGGVDNMGGVAANRITAGVSGITGTALGASGGDQNVQTHLHGINDPGHAHGVTDPTHTHVEVVGAGSPPGTQQPSATPMSATGPNPQGGYSTQASATGITINTGTTGITTQNYGTGSSANVQPTALFNTIIYAGV